MFIVFEVQANKNETAGTLVTTFSETEKDAAESKYHAILATAAISNVYKHSAFILTDNGRLLRSECYTHELEESTETES